IKTDNKIFGKYVVVTKILLMYASKPCYDWYWKFFTPNLGFNKDNLVFCSSVGTTIIPRNFTRKFYSLREKAKLPNTINLHALRHTYATRLLERGESLKTIQEILGHTDISITANIYTDVLLETKKKAAAKMDGLLARK
ncbi:tyrosine-type recombinase/integrase, partial [Paradesulfitobacterium ferrireducens]|uniref:tyrosine-type recombinase/integrase n=1 Tax=Paradesulfitobacterium ferrireducens TaxID=2816476 RepID=UPI001A8D8D62